MFPVIMPVTYCEAPLLMMVDDRSTAVEFARSNEPYFFDVVNNFGTISNESILKKHKSLNKSR